MPEQLIDQILVGAAILGCFAAVIRVMRPTPKDLTQSNPVMSPIWLLPVALIALGLTAVSSGKDSWPSMGKIIERQQ